MAAKPTKRKLDAYTLEQLTKIFVREFGPPFLPDGFVEARWDGKELFLRVGPRDVSIGIEPLSEPGEPWYVTGAGTQLGAWQIDKRTCNLPLGCELCKEIIHVFKAPAAYIKQMDTYHIIAYICRDPDLPKGLNQELHVSRHVWDEEDGIFRVDHDYGAKIPLEVLNSLIDLDERLRGKEVNK